MNARALGSEFSILHSSLRKPNMKLQCFLGKLSIVAQELCVKLSVEFCALCRADCTKRARASATATTETQSVERGMRIFMGEFAKMEEPTLVVVEFTYLPSSIV